MRFPVRRRGPGDVPRIARWKEPRAAARIWWRGLGLLLGRSWLWRSASLIGLAVIWEVVARLVDSNMLPTPVAVLAAVYRYTRSGQL
ncbi:MAG: hypothetical protein ACREPY_02015, partial [Rhodanobacteraceae bacterium]